MGSQSGSDGIPVLVGGREAAASRRPPADTSSTAPHVNQSHRLILKTPSSCGLSRAPSWTCSHPPLFVTALVFIAASAAKFLSCFHPNARFPALMVWYICVNSAALTRSMPCHKTCHPGSSHRLPPSFVWDFPDVDVTFLAPVVPPLQRQLPWATEVAAILVLCVQHGGDQHLALLPFRPLE